MSGRVVVEIDRLVVEGVRGSEGGVVAAALQRELELLVADRGLPAGLASPREVPTVEAEGNISDGDTAAVIGIKAARALYGALSR
jgi:hypothetical protein